MDNSNSRKEGVAYTYKKHNGYAPIASYLGQEGWCERETAFNLINMNILTDEQISEASGLSLAEIAELRFLLHQIHRSTK